MNGLVVLTNLAHLNLLGKGAKIFRAKFVDVRMAGDPFAGTTAAGDSLHGCRNVTNHVRFLYLRRHNEVQAIHRVGDVGDLAS